MNRKDLENAIYTDANGKLTHKDAHDILSGLIDRIEATVANGDKVSIMGFGSFEPRHRSARSGRNPQTGEAIQIEARTVPGFHAGREFKDRVR